MLADLFERIRAIAPYLFENDIGEPSLGEIECESGWGLIISHVVHEVHDHVSQMNDNVPGTFDLDLVYFDQIKEKHGKLRIYLRGGDDYLDGVVALAERVSGTVCERTGAIGQLHKKNGIYKTLSPSVARAEGYQTVKQKR
jgi:hypothetical protein